MKQLLRYLSLAFLLSCLFSIGGWAQEKSASGQWLQSQHLLNEKRLSRTERRYHKLTRKLAGSNDKHIRTLRRLEEGLYSALAQKDSMNVSDAPRRRLIDSNAFQRKASEALTTASPGDVVNYLPALDSLQTCIHYLTASQGSITFLTDKQVRQLESLSGTLITLQTQWQATARIQQMVRERKQLLVEHFKRDAFGSQFISFNKEVYYYQQQVAVYKALINDPDKISRKLVAAVSQSPSFRSFFAQNSMLAQLFRVPGSNNDLVSLNGLQTRAQVQTMVNAQLPAGADPGQTLQQQIALAEKELNKIKYKINELGGGSSELEIPAFRPNTQKTKTFWKRIEMGVDVQSQRPNGFLPVTSDIAFSVGYKISDKSVIGVGVGYKVGWGKDLKHIRITSEGLLLRSFIDVKMKGSLWISGGYEYNYQQGFTRISDLQHLTAWQKSGLLGLTKKYRIGKKNGKLQLLWDILSYHQVPQTQPLKFRIGYQL